MFEVWNKEKIISLSENEKQQWFDVLNYKLEEDRDISLKDPLLHKKQQKIKDDYFKYIESCPYADNFFKYYILKEEDRIVTVCRINIYDSKYVLEGLQTHKDYYRMGYASKLIDAMIFDLKKDGIKTLYSEARTWNDASNGLQVKLGFIKYGKENNNNLYELSIDSYVRRQLFDHWAKKYNKSVVESEKAGTYPFAGYSMIKYLIFEIIIKKPGSVILDMGIGTGEMTMSLYNLGYDITGVDLSENMIQLAKEKMSQAKFLHGEFHDVTSKLTKIYDFIIFTYSIHHLEYAKQFELLVELKKYLKKEGIVIIGDVSTTNSNRMKKLKSKYENIWDDEEFYPILTNYQSSAINEFYEISYEQINEVAGMYQLKLK